MEFFDYDHLWKEMRDQKNNDVLTQKRRQQLRANNHELRQLERHLQSAVANKQLNEQLRIAAQLREIEMCKEREENARLVADRELARKSVLKQEELERLTKKNWLEVLNCEMSKTHQKRRKEFEDAYKDYDQMENLMRQIQAEENLKREETELFREKCKKEMEETYKNIKLKQILEKEINIEENKRILSYQTKCDKIKSEKEVERKRVLEEKEELSKILGEQLSLIKLENEKRERLLVSLSIEERREKELQDFKEALAKLNEKYKKLCIESRIHFIEEKTRKDIQFKEEEEQFRIKNLSYLEERDKLWQLSEQKRRRKLMDYNKELKEMIEQRRYQKANKIAENLLELEKTKTDNELSNLLVKQERFLMISSVPSDLLRYLPPGVLKPSDKELLGCN